MPQYERTPPLDPLGQFALRLLNQVPGYETAEHYLSGEPDPSTLVNPLTPLISPLIGAAKQELKTFVQGMKGAGKGVKEPWEMTRLQFFGGGDSVKGGRIYRRWSGQKQRNETKRHKRIIEFALSEGKPVLPEVLKDYPDLAPSTLPAKAMDTVAIKQKLQDSSDKVMDDMLDVMLGVEGLHQFYEQEVPDELPEEIPEEMPVQ